MKRQFQITIEISASTKEVQPAFEALVTQAFEDLKKAVSALDNQVTLKASVAEVPAPAPAPAPPAQPKSA